MNVCVESMAGGSVLPVIFFRDLIFHGTISLSSLAMIKALGEGSTSSKAIYWKARLDSPRFGIFWDRVEAKTIETIPHVRS